MNSSLRTLLPVSVEPVRSSRFIQRRLPQPQAAVARGKNSSGVGRRAKDNRSGYSSEVMGIYSVPTDFSVPLGKMAFTCMR